LTLPLSESHVFAPVDFEVKTLADGLDAAGFDWSQPTLFSWLGITVYLTVDALEATLRTVAGCATGSEVVLTYSVTDPFLDELAHEFRRAITPVVVGSGEPFQTRLSPDEAEALICRCRLHVAEHPTRQEFHARYFAQRSDGLTPSTVERLMAASTGIR
jgi:O-methyltransferase involved in polyketide biosynthesis